MRSMSVLRPFTPLVAALFLTLPGACTITTDDSEPPPPTGTFSVRWSIAGSFEPYQCDRYLAYTLDLRIYDSRGEFVTQALSSCSAMSTSVALYPGGYTGTMTLTDGRNGARTTTLALRPFSVQSYATTVADTDFPPNAFY